MRLIISTTNYFTGFIKKIVKKIRRHTKRLEQLLLKFDPNHEAIFGEEVRSLLCEAKGDIQGAIKYKENQIKLIHKLHNFVHGKPYAKKAVAGYDYSDLSDHLDLLALLYYDDGDLDKAITTLKESKSLCKSHNIPFDGEDILREYLKFKNN